MDIEDEVVIAVGGALELPADTAAPNACITRTRITLSDPNDCASNRSKDSNVVRRRGSRLALSIKLHRAGPRQDKLYTASRARTTRCRSRRHRVATSARKASGGREHRKVLLRSDVSGTWPWRIVSDPPRKQPC